MFIILLFMGYSWSSFYFYFHFIDTFNIKPSCFHSITKPSMGSSPACRNWSLFPGYYLLLWYLAWMSPLKLKPFPDSAKSSTKPWGRSCNRAPAHKYNKRNGEKNLRMAGEWVGRQNGKDENGDNTVTEKRKWMGYSLKRIGMEWERMTGKEEIVCRYANNHTA